MAHNELIEIWESILADSIKVFLCFCFVFVCLFGVFFVLFFVVVFYVVVFWWVGAVIVLL